MTRWDLTRPSNRCFCKEFVSAFFLGDALLLQTEADRELPVREGACQPALPGGTRPAPLPERRGTLYCVQAVRGDLSRRRQSRSRRARAAMMARGGQPATISTWSSASIAVSARKPVRWTRSSRVQISNSPRRRAKSFTTTRKSCSPTGTAGSARLHATLK